MDECSGNGISEKEIPNEPVGKGSAASSRESTRNVVYEAQHCLEYIRIR